MEILSQILYLFSIILGTFFLGFVILYVWLGKDPSTDDYELD